MLRVKEIILIAVLTIIVVANISDFIVDFSHGAPEWHLYEEALVVLISIGAIIYLFLSLRWQRRELAQLRRDIEESQRVRRAADAQLQQTRQQMGRMIQQQFQQWQLTGSEQEVALLLLKGLSLREIATVRNTTEKTVRQQASAIYRKAGVSGRHSFAAWFIEDIL